jgi:hypothetical protein
VPHAALVEIFGPSGRKQPSLALRATVLVVSGKPPARRSLNVESHDSFSLNHSPLPEATLGPLCGDDMTESTAWRLKMKLLRCNLPIICCDVHAILIA